MLCFNASSTLWVRLRGSNSKGHHLHWVRQIQKGTTYTVGETEKVKFKRAPPTLWVRLRVKFKRVPPTLWVRLRVKFKRAPLTL